MGRFELPCFLCLNFRGWIKLIYDEITLIYSVKNAFNPTSAVQNIENGMFQNALFANGGFPNGDYSCLWAVCAHSIALLIILTKNGRALGSI